MFEAWGRIIFRRRRLVLTVAVIGVVLAAIWGTGVFGPRLLGRANWWAPGPLRRLYARYSIRESDEGATAPVRPAASVTSG
jgi:RND superfamily putative drug exporter